MLHMYKSKCRAKWVDLAQIIKGRIQTSISYRYNSLMGRLGEELP